MKTVSGLKKRHYMTRIAIIVITLALIGGTLGCDGDSSPFSKDLEIQDWYDLNDIRYNVFGNHILMNDLDAASPGYAELAGQTANGGKGWRPIGLVYYEGVGIGFSETFDGQGYEIRDMFINRPGEDYVGLFGSIEGAAVVQDIGIVNATVTGAEYVGSLVGYGEGTVSNSFSTGSVTGNEWVGGLAGYSGVVSNSYSSCSVIGDRNVGGVVGWSYGIVSNSYSTGSVSGNRWVGGLTGTNSHGTVTNSYSTGSVTGNEWVGGLAGNSTGHVSDSYFTGGVIGTSGVGGMVGRNLYDHGGVVSNSHYDYDEVLINGENIITVGALFSEDFDKWLANDKSLDINDRLSQEDGYYVVSNVTEFKHLLAFGQNGTLRFRLNSDLDLGGEPNFYIPCLAGEFDGNGHRISNLGFDFDFVYSVGLFGYVAPGGNVTDLAVENVDITGDENVGGVVGYNEGNVGDSSSTGSVNGNAFVGGLMGQNFGTVDNSYFTGTVAGNYSVGGLVGDNYGPLCNSYSTGSVSGISVRVGGLVGSNGDLGTVSDTYSTSSVTGNEEVGGLVGKNGGTVDNSYSTGTVTGDHLVGGLVGENYFGAVTNSFWDRGTSGQVISYGGTGKTTAEMQDITTFSGATWDIVAVVNPSTRNPSYVWNIVDDETYPFLSWQS
jgi:hypothetical protein